MLKDPLPADNSVAVVQYCAQDFCWILDGMGVQRLWVLSHLAFVLEVLVWPSIASKLFEGS